ncbi:hypothetical protein FSP39_001878 [Pinctada imbricata]|uniref:Uncharacterized protein n=1 Tax=Pinctada imbricata TaxID=66713 RepID=A0AA88Y518_PINIB|nr:hypothetical protein FSP39_001878 [Pinctada imbricata]
MADSSNGDASVRMRHGSGSPDRSQRRRHSSAEKMRQKIETARLSLQNLEPLRNNRICVYKGFRIYVVNAMKLIAGILNNCSMVQWFICLDSLDSSA